MDGEAGDVAMSKYNFVNELHWLTLWLCTSTALIIELPLDPLEIGANLTVERSRTGIAAPLVHGSDDGPLIHEVVGPFSRSGAERTFIAIHGICY
jgi:hypothetical protein